MHILQNNEFFCCNYGILTLRCPGGVVTTPPKVFGTSFLNDSRDRQTFFCSCRPTSDTHVSAKYFSTPHRGAPPKIADDAYRGCGNHPLWGFYTSKDIDTNFWNMVSTHLIYKKIAKGILYLPIVEKN